MRLCIKYIAVVKIKYMKMHLLILAVFLKITTCVYAPCFPGQEIVVNKTSGERICVNCPFNSYSKHGKKCYLCSVCHQGQNLIRKCTRNGNTVCHCSRGTFLKGGAVCKRCSSCPPGAYQTLECSHNMDRSCRKCPEGFTTNATNGKRCIPKRKPKPRQDVVIRHIVDWWIFLFIPIFLLLLGGAALIYYWRIRKRKSNQKHPVEAELLEIDSYPEQVLFVREEKREHLKMVRDLPAHLYEELGLKLNNHHSRNWIYLAGMLGFSRDQIRYLELEPRESTQNLINDWSSKEMSTVFNLHNALVNMGRGDAARVIEQYIYR